MKETDLFEPVKALFEAQGYTVYSEVQGPSGRADIVAVHGAELVAIELKTTLSMELIEQALGWTHYAHRVYVAVPKPKRYSHFGRFLLGKFGIGLIEVDFPDPKYSRWVSGVIGDAPKPVAKPDMRRPNWNRNILDGLRKALREEQRHGPPGGTAGGGYVTDYKLLMAKVREYLRPQEWRSLSDILEHCETHYASPRQSLANALLSYECDWCESNKEGGKLYFRHKKGD